MDLSDLIKVIHQLTRFLIHTFVKNLFYNTDDSHIIGRQDDALSIKNCIKILSARLTNQKIEDLAADVASQCRTALTQRVIGKSKILPPEQIRGYVRAFAACSLESIINERSDLKHLNSSQISKVILQAKELLIEMVIGDMQSMPPTVVADIAAAA